MIETSAQSGFSQMRVTVPADVLLRELDGESVILNLKSEIYFGLDDVGTRMWMLMTGSGSVQSAFDSLLSEYEVAPAALERDMRSLIDKLAAQGLIEVSSEPVA